MLMENKNVIVYGAGGAIGGAVARALARDGAAVFLAGRSLAPVRAVAEEISAEGGTAHAAQVDALNEQAIERHVADVATMVRRTTSRIDVLFNAIGMEDIQGTPLLDMAADDFMRPVITAARTQFLTARVVARHMTRQGTGVIMSITAEPTPAANMGGFMVACAAVEALWRGLACELGPHGIRLVIVRSAGSPDTPAVQEATRLHADTAGLSLSEYQANRGSGALMRRLPGLAEIANAATLLASDRASAMTAMLANVTCGSFVDL